MKVKSILFLFFSLAITSLHAQRIKGSDTVLPVAQQTAERFMNKHADARVTVTGGGTGVGIAALMDNTTDIAMASRPIKFSEKMKAKAAQTDIEDQRCYRLCRSGLCITTCQNISRILR